MEDFSFYLSVQIARVEFADHPRANNSESNRHAASKELPLRHKEHEEELKSKSECL
jgi:hypothetical protein